MSVTVKLACPVCPERLEYEHHSAEAWGSVPIDGQGCAQITIEDRTGSVHAHIQTHIADGTFRAAYEKNLGWQAERAAKLLPAPQ